MLRVGVKANQLLLVMSLHDIFQCVPLQALFSVL